MMKNELSITELEGQHCAGLAPRRLMGSIGNITFGTPSVTSAVANLSGSLNTLTSNHNINIVILSLG